MGQHAQRTNEPQGFAGLDALVSDITQDIAAAGTSKGEQSPGNKCKSSGRRPEPSVTRGPSLVARNEKSAPPPSESSGVRWFFGVAGIAFILWLIVNLGGQERPLYLPGANSAAAQNSTSPLSVAPQVSPPTSASFRGFKPITSDPMTVAIQRRLNVLGYSAGSVDGIMGARTRAAIESFQTDYGLAVDGEPSEDLLANLNGALVPQESVGQKTAPDEWLAPVAASPSVPNEPTSRKDLIDRVFEDNDYAWPAVASYMPGHKQLHTDGYSSVTIDNSRNDSNVFVKLYARGGAKDYPVRVCFVPARGRFTVDNVRAGNYDIRYRDLNTGGLSKSESFVLRAIRTVDGVQYSDMTMTLYKVAHGNTQMYGISEAEF